MEMTGWVLKGVGKSCFFGDPPKEENEKLVGGSNHLEKYESQWEELSHYGN